MPPYGRYMKLCAKAQEIQAKYHLEDQDADFYEGTRHHPMMVVRDRMDKSALARALHAHMNRCKMCST